MVGVDLSGGDAKNRREDIAEKKLREKRLPFFKCQMEATIQFNVQLRKKLTDLFTFRFAQSHIFSQVS